MFLEIDGCIIATAELRERAAADGHGAWVVSCHPGRLFTRNQAIAAMVLAERLAAGWSAHRPPWRWLARSSLPCLVAEVHEEVAGLRGGPVPGWIVRDAEDADPLGRVLDHGQDVGLGAGQTGGEEVADQDRLGLGAQELRPGRPGPPRRGADAVGLEDLPHGRRRDLDSQAGQLAVDPGVSPCRVLPG